MCWIWSATCASVARGAGFAPRHAIVSRRNAVLSAPRCLLKAATTESCLADQAATVGETNDGTKATITTPPLALRRPRIESGTLRGTSHRARADECEKITGASVTSRASLIV